MCPFSRRSAGKALVGRPDSLPPAVRSVYSSSSNRHRARARRAAIALAAAGAVALPHAQRTLAQSTWNGGNGNWSSPGSWTGGVPNSAAARAFIDGGNVINSVVTLDLTVQLNTLTL